jgi:hypothetical protein
MTMLCGSSTHVTIFGKADAPDEKVPVRCRLDDAHTQDHQGYFGGMLLHWSRQPPVIVYPLTGDGPIDTFANPTNAACVIKVSPPTPWATKPSNPIDDIRAFAEHVRRRSEAGPQPMTPSERAHYNRLGALLSAAASRLPRPEPFPIQDAGPHPQDEL